MIWVIWATGKHYICVQLFTELRNCRFQTPAFQVQAVMIIDCLDFWRPYPMYYQASRFKDVTDTSEVVPGVGHLVNDDERNRVDLSWPNTSIFATPSGKGDAAL